MPFDINEHIRWLEARRAVRALEGRAEAVATLDRRIERLRAKRAAEAPPNVVFLYPRKKPKES